MNKYLLVMFIGSNSALATTTYVKPGECIRISENKICGVSSISNEAGEGHHIYQETIKESKVFVTCELTTNKSPNTWDMIVNIIGVPNERRTIIKSYAHFDEESCIKDAETKNLDNK